MFFMFFYLQSNVFNIYGCDKPVGDWTPRLAQSSLPWQQGSAPQHFVWFH